VKEKKEEEKAVGWGGGGGRGDGSGRGGLGRRGRHDLVVTVLEVCWEGGRERGRQGRSG